MNISERNGIDFSAPKLTSHSLKKSLKRNLRSTGSLELSISGLTNNELQLVSTFKKYMSKNWINGSDNLSFFYYKFKTNLLTHIFKQTS